MQGNKLMWNNKTCKKTAEEGELKQGRGGEERQRVTSGRAGLETHPAGGLRQHKDGGGLGGQTPALILPHTKRKKKKEKKKRNQEERVKT